MLSPQTTVSSHDTSPDKSQRFQVRGKSAGRLCAMVLAAVVALLGGAFAWACPFCSAPQLTLSEQISQTDAAILGEWQEGEKPDFDAGKTGSTTYRVEKIIKAPTGMQLEPGQMIKVKEYHPSEKGSCALLVGTLDGTLIWSSPLELSRESFDYVLQAPGPENDQALRLKYFVKFLEADDPLLADDAYAEFANSPYKTIASIKAEFPLEQLRKWTFDEKTPVTRLGLYGLMLGLCGEQSDADLMREKIVSNDEEFRLGIDGIMGGYLLLSGEDGLAVLEETKLKPTLQTPNPVPFSETFAAMQAIKFLWEYAPDRVPAERLRESLRILMAHPDLADLVIVDLARWEDWSILPRLKSIYGQDPYDIPAIKRAIIGYLIQCVKNRPADETQPVPDYVIEAEEFLAHLEETDPKTVRTARLLFR